MPNFKGDINKTLWEKIFPQFSSFSLNWICSTSEFGWWRFYTKGWRARGNFEYILQVENKNSENGSQLVYIVGGFNPSDLLFSQIGSFFPGRSENKKHLKPPRTIYLSMSHLQVRAPTMDRYKWRFQHSHHPSFARWTLSFYHGFTQFSGCKVHPKKQQENSTRLSPNWSGPPKQNPPRHKEDIKPWILRKPVEATSSSWRFGNELPTTWNLFVLYFLAKQPSKTRSFPIKTVVVWVPGKPNSRIYGNHPVFFCGAGPVMARIRGWGNRCW